PSVATKWCYPGSAPNRTAFLRLTALPATFSPRLASAGRQRSFRCCQLFAKVLCQTTNRGDLRGTDGYPGFRFDPGAQFQVAQRIQPVLAQRPIRIDGAPQQQADLIRYQPPDHAGPLVLRRRLQLGEELALVRLTVRHGLERLGEAAALREGV